MTLNLIKKNKTRKDKTYNSNCLNESMKNPISIEESLKELNDDVLKNIREEYKKGNNLNDIIQHYKTKNPEAISKIYSLIKFEFDEQERFLNEELNFSEAEIFFFELEDINYKRIINTTKQGIEEGVADFLKRNNTWQLYLSNLSAFCYDKTLADIINLRLNSLKLDLLRKDIPAYSEDIRGKYSGFVFNYSYNIFIKKFR